MNCIVVGAGLLGLSSAWYLSLLGYKVKVFESHSDVSLETSFANGDVEAKLALGTIRVYF